MSGVFFLSTIYVDRHGVAMNNRVFFINAAIEEMQTAGYLCEQTLESLSRDEFALVMQRSQETH
jgi:hypothetical protein